MIDLHALSEREYIAEIARRPGMFTGRATYERMAQFLVGYDLGSQRAGGRGLEGVSAWFQERLGHHSPLHWTSIVLQLAFPSKDRSLGPLAPEEDAHALNVLFELLDEFLAERDGTHQS
ncbi:hypothetical protein [Glycomyces tarimensis]